MEYLEFNGRKTTEIGLRIVGVSKGSFADLRDTYTDVDGRIGAMHHSQPVGMYRFSVTFRTTFNSIEEREDKIEEITDLFYTEEFVRIRQSTRLDRYRKGKVESVMDYDPSFHVLEVAVDFITDPFALSLTPVDVFETFTEPSQEHSFELTDIGTAFSEYEILVKFKDSVTNPEISQGTATLGLRHPFSPNDVLMVNTDTFEVNKLRMNGSEITSITSLVLDTVGEFPRIERGSRTVTIRATGEFTCDVTMEYVKRYLL